MKIKGKYYNGIDSKAYEAILLVEGEDVSIQVIDNREIHSWYKDKIDYKNYSNHLIQLNYINQEGTYELFESVIGNELDYEDVKKTLFFLHKDIPSKLLFFSFKALVPIAVAILGLMAATYFYVIPAVAEKIAEHTSLDVEEKLGDLIEKSINQDLVIDSGQTKVMRSFYTSLHHPSKYRVQIYVVDDDETVNAFAIPSGKIYVYTGLLKQIKKPEQLVSLLYHEIGHVEHKHSLKHIYRSLSRSLILSALLNDVNGISNIVIENADMIMQLKYSKELESDADRYSIQSMYDEKIDIRGFVELFEILEAESGTAQTPEILSTHPINKNRIASAQVYLKKQNPTAMRPVTDSLFWKLY